MGTILSLDYGLKRIGVAISDPDRKFAFPRKVIANKDFKHVLSSIKNLIEENEIYLIIIGLPLNMPGVKNEKSKMTKTVEDFVKKLKQKVNISIELIDERLSSFTAEQNLFETGIKSKKIKSLVDSEAARILLEEYIEKYKHQNAK